MTSNNSLPSIFPSQTECFTSVSSANNVASSKIASSTITATSKSYTPTTPEPDSADVFKPSMSHIKVEKVYPCSQCTKHFNRPSALETHSYTHSFEKPFQCLSPNCGRKFSVVSNLRRHFKVHQKQAVGSNRITSQERVRCVRQLIKKKPSDDKSTNDNQDPNIDSLGNIIADKSAPLGDTHNHHHLILSPMQNTTNNPHTHAGTYIAHQDIPTTQAESSLYYRIPQNWSDQENNVNHYNDGNITTIHQNQLPDSVNDIPSSILLDFGGFSFFQQP